VCLGVAGLRMVLLPAVPWQGAALDAAFFVALARLFDLGGVEWVVPTAVLVLRLASVSLLLTCLTGALFTLPGNLAPVWQALRGLAWTAALELVVAVGLLRSEALDGAELLRVVTWLWIPCNYVLVLLDALQNREVLRRDAPRVASRALFVAALVMVERAGEHAPELRATVAAYMAALLPWGAIALAALRQNVSWTPSRHAALLQVQPPRWRSAESAMHCVLVLLLTALAALLCPGPEALWGVWVARSALMTALLWALVLSRWTLCVVTPVWAAAVVATAQPAGRVVSLEMEAVGSAEDLLPASCDRTGLPAPPFLLAPRLFTLHAPMAPTAAAEAGACGATEPRGPASHTAAPALAWLVLELGLFSLGATRACSLLAMEPVTVLRTLRSWARIAGTAAAVLVLWRDAWILLGAGRHQGLRNQARKRLLRQAGAGWLGAEMALLVLFQLWDSASAHRTAWLFATMAAAGAAGAAGWRSGSGSPRPNVGQ
jgi:hypothetical protein